MRVGVALQEVLNLFESDRPAAAIEVAVVNKEALETALCPTPPRGLRPRVTLLIKGITALEPCRVVPQVDPEWHSRAVSREAPGPYVS